MPEKECGGNDGDSEHIDVGAAIPNIGRREVGADLKIS